MMENKKLKIFPGKKKLYSKTAKKSTTQNYNYQQAKEI